MRFIIREQEYETLVAAGRLNYRSGVLENWRLTRAVDDYMVMRIDLDRRDAGESNSTLFHLLLEPRGRLERAKLRHLSPDGDQSADFLVEDDSLHVSRASAAGVEHDEIERPAGLDPILPGFIGLALVVRQAGDIRNQPVIIVDRARQFAPGQAIMEIEALEEERLAVTGQTLAVRPYLIDLDGTRQTIWLDKVGLPVRVEDDEGVVAVEDRYVRHR